MYLTTLIFLCILSKKTVFHYEHGMKTIIHYNLRKKIIINHQFYEHHVVANRNRKINVKSP
jgi:hypothetical protein